MNTPLQFLAAAAMATACATCAAQATPAASTASAPPAGTAKTDSAQAGDRCEAAVAETVRRMRGRDAKDVEFIGAKRAISPAGDSDETGVKGEGRYRGPAGSTPFTYSCAFNAKTGATSGVVFREPPGARTGAASAWEPDLSKVSPQACETAAASELKQKYPRVGRIAFDSNTRQLAPAANARTRLEGSGAVQRAQGMHSVPFKYRCEYEAGSGQVVSVQTSE